MNVGEFTPDELERMRVRLLGVGEVLARVGLTPAEFLRLVDDGEFPRPIEVRGREAWFDVEVDNWIRFKAWARDCDW